MTDTNADQAGHSIPKAPPKENLIRARPGIELVRAEGEAMPTLTGHFAVWNTWAEISSAFEGNFMERIAPGAFTKTIRESRDNMRVLFQHGQDPQIGDKVLGPIRVLQEDEVGARYEVPMLDTSYNRDLIPGLEAGLYGASFRFRVMKEEFVSKPKRSRDNPDALPERTITEAQVREFGPVTFGAYKEATAGLRSMTDDFLFTMLAEDPERLAKLISAYMNRQMESEPSEATTPDSLAVTTTANLDGETVARKVTEYQRKNRKEPEPSAATTRARATRPGALYTTRKEMPKWRL